MTTWTPKTQQAETWTAAEADQRIFSPLIFDRKPVFSTGSSGGVWDEKTKQPEIWTPA
jgi:hypothetical protein